MKKRIAVTLLALIMCLFAVGCGDTNLPAPEYKLNVIGAIECLSGETPDWSKGLTLTVNGEEVPIDNSAVAYEKVGGTELRPIYLVTYVYGGVTLSARVTLSIKSAGDDEPITPIEDKTNMTAEQLAALGVTLSKTYDSYSFVSTTETEAFEGLLTRVDKVQSVGGNDKDIAYECTETFSVSNENIYQDLWYLRNYIDVENDDMFSIYLDNDDSDSEDWIKRSVTSEFMYEQATVDDSGFEDVMPVAFAIGDRVMDANWFDIKSDGSYFVRNFNLVSAYAALNGIKPESVGSAVPYSIALTVENGHVSKIICGVSLVGSGVSVDFTYGYFWSDFNNVTVELPANAPELEMSLEYNDFITPSDVKNHVSQSETQALQTMLDKRYNNVAFASTDERVLVTAYNGKVNNNNVYREEESYYINSDGERISFGKTNSFTVIGNNESAIYDPYDNSGNYIRYIDKDTKSVKDLYYSPADLGLSGDMFGTILTSLGTVYAITSESKETASAILKNSLDLKTIDRVNSKDDKIVYKPLYMFEVVSFFMTVDNGNITSWDLLFKYKDEKNDLADYRRIRYSYSDFGSTVVPLPSSEFSQTLSPWDRVDVASKTKFTNALAKSFENVRVKDTITSLLIDSDIYSSISEIYPEQKLNTVTEFTDNKIRRDYYTTDPFMGLFPVAEYEEMLYEGDKWYYIDDTDLGDKDDNDNIITEPEKMEMTTDDSDWGTFLNYYVPRFDFSALNNPISKYTGKETDSASVLSLVNYDEAAKSYILLNSGDFKIEDFLEDFFTYFYRGTIQYSDIVGVVFEVNDNDYIFAIRIIASAKMVIDNDMTNIQDVIYSFSAEFSDYGNVNAVEFEYEKAKAEAQKAAKAVDDIALTIPSFDTINAENYESISDAYDKVYTLYSEYSLQSFGSISSYSGLIDSYMKNLERVQNVQNALLTFEATLIESIDSAFEALPQTVTLNDKDAIENLRAQYDMLLSNSKRSVTNLSYLLQAEAKLIGAMIDDLPSEITLENKEAVERIRTAYDDLTSTYQSLLSEKEKKLIAAEETIAVLLVQQLIASSTEKITDNNYKVIKATIEEANMTFDALSTAAKKLVDNLSDLALAEKNLADFVNDANTVKTMIDEITVLITDANHVEASKTISEARSAYNALSELKKEFITQLEMDRLEEAEKAVTAYNSYSQAA